MTDPRAEYKDANHYNSEGDRPGPDSPRARLPVPHRQVWAALQDGLRNLPRVKETTIWCGTGWKWSWQYSYGDRQLAFLLPTDRGVCAVLVVADIDLEALMGHKDLRPKIRELLNCAEPKEARRTCLTPVLDVETARDFLLAARALLEVVRARP